MNEEIKHQNTTNKGMEYEPMLVAGREYRIEFDENDNNGNPCGRVHQCIIGDLHLETCFMEGTKFNASHYADVPAFEIEKKIFPALKFIPFTGNIIWNSYTTTEDYALMLINHLIDSKVWSVMEAPTEQYEKFAGGQAFDKSDLQACY